MAPLPTVQCQARIFILIPGTAPVELYREVEFITYIDTILPELVIDLKLTPTMLLILKVTNADPGVTLLINASKEPSSWPTT